jgi:hypothetical protein
MGFRVSLRSLLRPGLPAALVGAAFLAGAIATAGPARAAEPSGPGTTSTLGEALTASDAEQMALVEHLRSRGAIFYGAWWCSHCFRQKNLFGQQAGNRLPYVECDKTETGRERCRAEGIRAYPTWVMGSSRLEGVQSLEDLKRWSGFGAGPQAATP